MAGVIPINKQQKEVEKAKLTAEAKELKHLKAIYTKAAEDVSNKIAISDGKIKILLKDYDNLDEVQKSILQSQIYQKKFQESLQKQLDGFLADLNSGQYKSIDEYLNGCYETGFLGSMYDIHGQGIPIITPIDQKQVVKAKDIDSKISKKLYTKLGEDVDLLKKRIANNISRGIATSDSFANIARNISSASNMGFNKAMRIARTEGHRIQATAAFDAQHAAKKAGADIVKQWDAALDGRTRDTHRKLDGQIRELDEPFEVNGHKAMHPAGFGRPEEDINCRCALLQRARWALDEDELQTLQDRAAYYGLDKTEDFENFKKKYLKASAAEKVAKKMKKKSQKTLASPAKGNTIQLDTGNFSDAFTSKKAERDNTQKLVDYVNNLQGSNPKALLLYNSIGKMENYSANGIKFSISHGKSHAVSITYRRSTGDLVEVKLTIPKLSGSNLAGQVNTTLHEQMHLIDLMLKDNPTKAGAYFGESFVPLKDAVKNATSDIDADVKNLFTAFHAECAALKTKAKKDFDDAHDQIRAKYIPNGVWAAGADYKTYQKEYKKLQNAYYETIDYESRNALGGGISSLEDIYDALSGGRHRDSGVVKYGHGSKYYSSQGKRINEIVANYGALSVTRPDLVDMLRKDKPELVQALDEMLEEMAKKV